MTDEDEFLIIASDGLWEVLGSEDAVSIAREELKARNDCSAAADALLEKASKKADDDITVIVVGFDRLKSGSCQRRIVYQSSESLMRPRFNFAGLSKLNSLFQQ